MDWGSFTVDKKLIRRIQDVCKVVDASCKITTYAGASYRVVSHHGDSVSISTDKGTVIYKTDSEGNVLISDERYKFDLEGIAKGKFAD